MRIPIIETKRLLLRPLNPADWRAVQTYASIPEVMQYIPEGVMDEVQARAYVEQHTGEEAEAHALILKAEKKLVGHMIFHPWFAHRTYEVGWVLHPALHGRGYATEAAWALLQHAFDNLDAHRVIATCQPENHASCRVMEKIGMRREAHFRKCIFRGGDKWWDEYFYAMLREEWAGAG